MKIASANIKRMNLVELKPHPRNPRIHPEKGTQEWDALVKSLAHDYFDLLIVNSGKKAKSLKNVLVSGHLRLKVLKDSGFIYADVVVVDYDEATHLARMMSANKLIGTDDTTKMKDLLEELDDGSIDLTALSGYCETELERLMTQYHVDGQNINNESPKSDSEQKHDSKTIHKCPNCGTEFE